MGGFLHSPASQAAEYLKGRDIEVEVDLAKAQQYGLKPGDVRRATAFLVQGEEGVLAAAEGLPQPLRAPQEVDVPEVGAVLREVGRRGGVPPAPVGAHGLPRPGRAAGHATGRRIAVAAQWQLEIQVARASRRLVGHVALRSRQVAATIGRDGEAVNDRANGDR